MRGHPSGRHSSQPLRFGICRHAASEFESRAVTGAGLFLPREDPPIGASIGSIVSWPAIVRVRMFCAVCWPAVALGRRQADGAAGTMAWPASWHRTAQVMHSFHWPMAPVWRSGCSAVAVTCGGRKLVRAGWYGSHPGGVLGREPESGAWGSWLSRPRHRTVHPCRPGRVAGVRRCPPWPLGSSRSSGVAGCGRR
jgi:hypothetical protein